MATEKGMNITKLVLMVSEDCNFSCQYCYHKKEKKEMSRETAEKALDFFLPRMPEFPNLYFLGGEPLLNLDLIRHTIEYVEKKSAQIKKKCGYNISTNGSLITPEILDFFNRYQFTVELSFDGLAQDKARKKDSFRQLVEIIDQTLKLPGIQLVVNSVFFPPTVKYLSESVRFILDLGVPHVSLGLALDRRWNRPTIKKFENEFKRLKDILMDHYRETGNQPLHFFPDLISKGIWCCSAGQSQLTVSPDGEVWGCALFYEYFKKRRNSDIFQDYFFGTIDELIHNHKRKYPAIVNNYQQLCQDNFQTNKAHCFLCPHIESCGVCPISSALYWDRLDKVPTHICRINRIAIEEKQKLLNRTDIMDGGIMARKTSL
jgi:sulfatase maturation enzyme AslB (radical SAM superfamily)